VHAAWNRRRQEDRAPHAAGDGSAEWLMSEIWKHFRSSRQLPNAWFSSAQPEPAPVGGRPQYRARIGAAIACVVAAIERGGLRRGFRSFELPRRLDDTRRSGWSPTRAARALDLFEHSPYFAKK
jgi:hypothetical protein